VAETMSLEITMPALSPTTIALLRAM